MMTYRKWYFGLVLMILLVACTVEQELFEITRVVATAVPPTFTSPLTIPTTTVLLSPASTHIASPTVLSTSTPTPTPTSAELVTAVTIPEPMPQLQRLMSWSKGYRRSTACHDGPYHWLDESHIMVLPIVSYTPLFGDPEGGQVTRPSVVNVLTGKIWIIEQAPSDDCEEPVYSQALSAVIESNDGIVRLRGLDGGVLATYEGGNPLHLGATGLRLLAGDTWIDLVTGQTIVLPIDDPSRLYQPAWTAQDTRFYDCCAQYGDALAETYYSKNPLGDLYGIGTDIYGLDYSGEYAQWFDDGQYVMHEPKAIFWSRQDSSNSPIWNPPTIPLIDPVNQSYINIGERLGLTYVSGCGWGHWLRPLHDQIWLQDCTDTGLLVDVPALTTQEVRGYTFVEWSPNGRYALLTANDQYALLDPDTMTFTAPPDVPATAFLPVWSETADYLALTAPANDGVYVVQTAGGQSHLVAVQPSSHMAWRPDSNQLALALADGTIVLITAADGSSQILTSAALEVRDLRWSSAGNYLAFVNEADVNILSFGR